MPCCGPATRRREVAVAFADLAGFTALSDRLPIDQLGRVAARFEALVLQVAEGPVRLVKMIGDGAMLVADDTGALVAALVELLGAENLPPVHAGVARGPALHMAGDWVGRTVNLAARLCAAAPEGAVLAGPEVRAAAPELGWQDAGELELRGFGTPVRAHLKYA